MIVFYLSPFFWPLEGKGFSIGVEKAMMKVTYVLVNYSKLLFSMGSQVFV